MAVETSKNYFFGFHFGIFTLLSTIALLAAFGCGENLPPPVKVNQTSQATKHVFHRADPEAIRPEVTGIDSGPEPLKPEATNPTQKSDGMAPLPDLEEVFTNRSGSETVDEKSKVDWSEIQDTSQPIVILSQRHKETCHRLVGDSLTDLQLHTAQGSTVTLKNLLSENLSVVVWADNRSAMSREQTARLNEEVAQRYAEFGVRTFVVHHGEPNAHSQVDLGPHIIVLFDTEGVAFQQIASKYRPRTYLLDADGRIVWFDIEYSRHMRFQLHNAIAYYLNHQ